MIDFKIHRPSNPLSAARKPLTLANKIGFTFFFGFFLLIGSIITWTFIKGGIASFNAYSWKQIPCEIISSSIVERPNDEQQFYFNVRYQYEYQGQHYTSTVYKLKYAGSSSYTETLDIKNRFSENSSPFAYVNPQNPSESFLEKESLGMIFFAFFPMIFVLIGIGGIFFIWTRSKALSSSSISAQTNKKTNSNYVALFVFFLLAVIGGSLLFFWAIPSFLKAQESKNWPSVPCEIVSSRVDSHCSDDGTTYSVNIFYHYRVNGVSYSSNRYDLSSGSSSGYKSKAQIVAQYPSGKKTVCYYNPQKNSEAVLKVGMTFMQYIGFIPLILFLIGTTGILFTLIGLFKNSENVIPSQFPATSAVLNQSPIKLTPASCASKRFGMFLVFALIWNAISIAACIVTWRDKETMGMIISAIFLLVGIGIIVACIWNLLATLNAQPEITLSSQDIILGKSVTASWKLIGDIQPIERLHIYLQGREEATYKQGTRTHTDKNIFYKTTLADIRAKAEMFSGQCQIQLPANTIHSFDASNNKIIWSLHFCAEIPSWPDTDNEYKLNVLPTTEPLTS